MTSFCTICVCWSEHVEQLGPTKQREISYQVWCPRGHSHVLCDEVVRKCRLANLSFLIWGIYGVYIFTQFDNCRDFLFLFFYPNSQLKRPSYFHHISITLFHYYHNTKSQFIFHRVTLISINGHHSFSAFH